MVGRFLKVYVRSLTLFNAFLSVWIFRSFPNPEAVTLFLRMLERQEA